MNGTHWTQLQDSRSPDPRQGAVAALDRAHHQVVLFGGIAHLAGERFPNQTNETWTWDGAWSRRPSGADDPIARSGAAMAFDGQRVVMFGGDSGSGSLGDTWIWDGGQWIPGPASGPPARSGATMAYDEQQNKVVLFGGNDGNTVRKDTWLWDPGHSKWDPGPEGPIARTRAAMAYDEVRQDIVMFGGQGLNGRLGDTWIWDSNGWSERQPSSTLSTDGSPVLLEPRESAAMAFDAATGNVVMFGGGVEPPANLDCNAHLEDPRCIKVGDFYQVADKSSDTWIWNGSGWQLQDPFDPTEIPTPRSRAAMAQVPQAPGRSPTVLLFGGLEIDLLGDTWLWDGVPKAGPTSSSTSSTSTSTSTSTTSSIPATALPRVHGLIPASDSTSGGKQITIDGSGFTGATSVSFGNPNDPTQDAKAIDCSQTGACNVVDDTRMTVTAPAHPRATVDVLVTNAIGRSPVGRDPVADDDEFTYFPPDVPPPGDIAGPQGSGFTQNTPPPPPAPPGGFGSAPVPGFGSAPVPGFGSAPVPGVGTAAGVSAGFTPGGAPGAGGSVASLAPPANPPSAVSGGASAPPGPPPAATPGFPPAGASPPAAPAAAPFPDVGVPGAAPHFNMVRRTTPGHAAGSAMVLSGVVVLLMCFGFRRRPRAQMMPARSVARYHQPARQGAY